MDTAHTLIGRPKDRWFDHGIVAVGVPLRTLVSDLIEQITKTETRTRRRRLKAQADFERAVEAVAVNLAYLVIRKSITGWLAVVQDDGHRTTRYEHPSLTVSTIRKVLLGLEGSELCIRRGKAGTRKTTTIQPLWSFRDRVVALGISPTDFGRDPNEEVITLSAKTRSFKAGKGGFPILKHTHFIDYDEQSQIVSEYRAQVRRINTFLQASDIDFVLDGIDPVVAVEDRLMKRRFSSINVNDVRWDLNGRLYGGFWQNLKKDRRQHLRINGEHVVDLDFKNAFPTLAYLHTGHEPPEGDHYDLTDLLPGYDKAHPTHRDGVKAGFNALLNGGAAEVPDILDKLPLGSTADKLRTALSKKHPALKHVFRTNLGLTLMYKESCILLNVIDRLMDQNIVVLGMHDGCMVAASNEMDARSAMEAASEDVLGVMTVVAKAVYGHPGPTEGLLAA